MSTTARIDVGTRSVGSVSVDELHVRGEGGPHDPRLVLPLTVTLQRTPADAQIALTGLTCSFHLGDDVRDDNQLGPTITSQLFVHSLPTAEATIPAWIRMPVTLPIISKLEQHREAQGGDLRALLRLAGTTAYLYATGGAAGPVKPNRPIEDHPFGYGYGLFSILAPFDSTTIWPLPLRLPASTWVSKVLPGIGVEHVRMIEISLPKSFSPLPSALLKDFDDARRDLDSGRARECIQKCRDLRHGIEEHLGASRTQTVSDVVAQTRGLGLGSDQHIFLDAIWKALADITNASHHTARPSLSDARAVFFTTAVILDYIRTQLAT